MRLSFHGAAGTVTGSRYLIEDESRRILVDCGLFQGYKQLRLRNWTPPAFEPQSIDAVVLTHAHIDHSGYLPRLIQEGFRGPIYCSEPTRDLCSILLPDSGHLFEADAEYARRRGFSRHDPPLPLFTEEEGRRALGQFRPIAVGEEVSLGGRLGFQLFPVGHILGACGAAFTSAAGRLVFTGDLGRSHDLVMRPPSPRPVCDWLVVESTYGNRRHITSDAEAELAAAVQPVIERGGTVVIPAFAVGRTQLLLALLARLIDAGKLSGVPVVVDSPMATSVTSLYSHHKAWHKLDERECQRAFDRVTYARTPEQSKALDAEPSPKIIVSASGMATGGRVVHHLKAFAPDPRNMILLAGFQAGGTRGASLLAGEESIKIHGEWVSVRAQVQYLEMLSAHADADEIVAWCGAHPESPREAFITHGEPDAADTLRRRLQNELGWAATVPAHGDAVELRATSRG